MTDIGTALSGVRASTAELVVGLGALGWSDADITAPSLCTGWTRGHVLTHIARNADGIADTLAGALRGEIVERYPDGWAARNAAIDAGAERPFAELAADVRESAERLDRVLDAVEAAGGWELETEKGHPARHWLTARWKEVEIHRVDLAAGYGPDRWPPALVGVLFETEIARLAERAAGPLRVTVTAPRSVRPDLVGRTWTAGDGEPVEVHGPDWGIVAWLVGRPQAATDVLPAPPELGPYN